MPQSRLVSAIKNVNNDSLDADVYSCRLEQIIVSGTTAVTSDCHDHDDVILKTFTGFWGRFKNAYELLNLRALKCSLVNKMHIF